jgi:hypothetical protein
MYQILIPHSNSIHHGRGIILTIPQEYYALWNYYKNDWYKYCSLTFSGCVWNLWYSSSGVTLWKSISNSCLRSSKSPVFRFFAGGFRRVWKTKHLQLHIKRIFFSILISRLILTCSTMNETTKNNEFRACINPVMADILTKWSPPLLGNIKWKMMK